MSDNEFVPHHGVYDGQGNHLYGWLPPLMVNNVLTEEYHRNKAVRPATEWVALRDQSEQPELGMVYMLPLGMKPGDTIPPGDHSRCGAADRRGQGRDDSRRQS